MKKLSIVFWALAALLSDWMCAVVAYNYCDLSWGGGMPGTARRPAPPFST